MKDNGKRCIETFILRQPSMFLTLYSDDSPSKTKHLASIRCYLIKKDKTSTTSTSTNGFSIGHDNEQKKFLHQTFCSCLHLRN